MRLILITYKKTDLKNKAKQNSIAYYMYYQIVQTPSFTVPRVLYSFFALTQISIDMSYEASSTEITCRAEYLCYVDCFIFRSVTFHSDIKSSVVTTRAVLCEYDVSLTHLFARPMCSL